MLTIKSNVQGNLVVVPLPSDNEEKPSENQEYVVTLAVYF
ncbi:hypothetical protein IGK51_003811 [Enterococcus sp. DIV0098]